MHCSAYVIDCALEPLGPFTFWTGYAKPSHLFNNRVYRVVLEGTVLTHCGLDETELPLWLRCIDESLRDAVIHIREGREANLERTNALAVFPDTTCVFGGRKGVDLGNRRLAEVVESGQETISLILLFISPTSSASRSYLS